MKAAVRKFARTVLPESLRRWWRRRFGWCWFHGDFSTWAEAKVRTKGYEDQTGFDRVVEAARAVRAGRAVWDRDGMPFNEPELHHPLLQALNVVASENGGRLELVDFGGALGSTWWQHRQALAGVVVSWRIVEQAALVDAGRREFTAGPLSFHTTLSEALAARHVQVLLLSGVLSYLEAPHALLADVIDQGIPHVILDRTPLVTGDRDRLVVQSTPPELGGGSYPCWLFERERLLAPLRAHYELVAEWPVDFDRVDGTVTYHGFHFRHRRGGSGRPA